MRIKGGVYTRQRKKKIFRRAKGFRLGKKNLYRHAVEQVEKGLTYAYRDRKLKKRNFRALWINRINAAVRSQGFTYSKFICGLRKAGIPLNRKILSEIAIRDSTGFNQLIGIAKKHVVAVATTR